MSEVVRRFFLRRKERKTFLHRLSETLKMDLGGLLGSKPQIEVIETQRHNIFLIGGKPLIAESKEALFPTLSFTQSLSRLPEVVVDMGAVPKICGGADIMAPGIVEIRGKFEKNSLVVVLDERNRRPIAVAQSLFDSEYTVVLQRGRTFETLHYVGDDIWNVIRGLTGNEKVKT